MHMAQPTTSSSSTRPASGFMPEKKTFTDTLKTKVEDIFKQVIGVFAFIFTSFGINMFTEQLTKDSSMKEKNVDLIKNGLKFVGKKAAKMFTEQFGTKPIEENIFSMVKKGFKKYQKTAEKAANKV